MGKNSIWSRNRRALSPIFATVLLATIIILFGSVAYYYANTLTTNTTNNYVKNVSDNQQSISERIGFENIVYTSPTTLTVSIINSGDRSNVTVDNVFLYDSNHNIVPGSPYTGSQISPLYPIAGGSQSPIAIPSLNAGEEAYFNVTITGTILNSNTIYTLHLVTGSGSYFDHEFTS